MKSKTPSYKKGYKDASNIVKSLGPRIAKALVIPLGFGRKSKENSNPRLYQYCRGFNNRLDKEETEDWTTVKKNDPRLGTKFYHQQRSRT